MYHFIVFPVKDVDPETSLVDYLRDHALLKGTKIMCRYVKVFLTDELFIKVQCISVREGAEPVRLRYRHGTIMGRLRTRQ